MPYAFTMHLLIRNNNNRKKRFRYLNITNEVRKYIFNKFTKYHLLKNKRKK